MRTIALLLVSNVFMTFAWYGHLRFKSAPLWLAVFGVFSGLCLEEPLGARLLAGFACPVAASAFLFR